MHNRPKTFSRLLGALACGAAFCAPTMAADEGAKLAMRYDVTAREYPISKQYAKTCLVQVAPAEDGRRNKETVGIGGKGALLTDDIGPWITDGLAALKDFGYTVQPVETAGTPTQGIAVKASVTRAYTWHVSTKIFSMVALKAQFLDRNGVLQEKLYRAHGDKTNIWNAASEYETTLNYGLNNLLPAIARDLQSLCEGRQVDAYTYTGPYEPE